MGDKNQKSKNKSQKLSDSQKAAAKSAHDQKQTPVVAAFAPSKKK